MVDIRQIPVAGYARRHFRNIACRGKLRSAYQPLAGFPVPVVDKSRAAKEIREGKRVPPQAEIKRKIGANFPFVLHVQAPVAEGLMVASVLLDGAIGQAR